MFSTKLNYKLTHGRSLPTLSVDWSISKQKVWRQNNLDQICHCPWLAMWYWNSYFIFKKSIFLIYNILDCYLLYRGMKVFSTVLDSNQSSLNASSYCDHINFTLYHHLNVFNCLKSFVTKVFCLSRSLKNMLAHTTEYFCVLGVNHNKISI